MLESIFDNVTYVEPNETIEKIEDIEVLDNNDVIPIESIIPTKQVEEVKPKEVDKTKDKIFTIQIILIIGWVILTTIVYFFGYPLFEPFINV